MRVLTTFTFLLFFLAINAQDVQHRCHATDMHYEAYETNEEYRHTYDALHLEREERLEYARNNPRLPCDAPIVIPIAVHYDGVGNQPLSCLIDLAQSQIDLLNRDYGALNPDISFYGEAVENSTLLASYLAEEGACIQFCLADQNHPEGFGLNDGDYAITLNQNYVQNDNWPNYTQGVWAGYINVFVTTNVSQGVLGFSPLDYIPNGAGVVIRSCAFGDGTVGCEGNIGSGNGFCQSQIEFGSGPGTPGRTLTHELGHFLGLNHPWGNNDADGNPVGCSSDDGFSDTPNSSEQNFGSNGQCPSTGAATTSCVTQDMFMNYMDYAYSTCRVMFSEQQVTYMYNKASGIWGTDSDKCSSSVTINDAAIAEIVFPGGQACGVSVAPKVRLRNVGQADLTSVDIVYSAENGGSNTYSWTGLLGQNELELVTLSAISNPSSDFTLSIATNSPNGQNDENITNDEITQLITIISGTTLPFTEDVEDFTAPFPAQNIEIFNPDGDAYKWDRRPGISGNGSGVYSIYFNNSAVNSAAEGTEDWFILPEMDVTGFASVAISYDFAGTYFNNTRIDSLAIMYSYGCADDWQEAWIDGGASLATASPSTTLFLPTASQWTAKNLGISTTGNNFIRIAFVNKTGRGNALYLDNINVQGSDVVIANEEVESLESFVVSPNPSNGIIGMDVRFDQITNFSINIHNIVGQRVYVRETEAQEFKEQINISDLPNGIYMISIIAGNQITTKKIVVAK
jgi:hypothetical protein